jgi:hypothetical protein
MTMENTRMRRAMRFSTIRFLPACLLSACLLPVCLLSGLTLAVAFGTLLVSAEPAQARIFPWCLHDRFGGVNCGFVSRQQCWASRGGNADMCLLNGLYQGPVRDLDRAPASQRPARRSTRAQRVYPWCLQTSWGGRRCSFVSREQCQSARTGNADMCMVNALYGQPRNTRR